MKIYSKQYLIYQENKYDLSNIEKFRINNKINYYRIILKYNL